MPVVNRAYRQPGLLGQAWKGRQAYALAPV